MSAPPTTPVEVAARTVRLSAARPTARPSIALMLALSATPTPHRQQAVHQSLQAVVAGTAADGAVVGDPQLDIDKKIPAKRHTLRPTHMLGEAGMWRIYSEFQSLPLKRKQGSEVRGALRIDALAGWRRVCVTCA